MIPRRQQVTLDITTGTILKLIGLVLLLFGLWYIRNVVTIALFAIIFASGITPVATFLQRYRVPRAFSIALVYVVVLGALTVILVMFGQLLSDQIRDLAADVPRLYDSVVDRYFHSAGDAVVSEKIRDALEGLNRGLVQVSQQIVSGTIGLFGGLFTFISILILTFYMTLEQDGFKRFITSVSPVSYIPYLHQLVERVQLRLGAWIRGQLLLSFIIGALSYVGLLIIGVDHALSLALIAGLSELVPIIGPIIGAVPAVLVALGQNPILALAVLILYLIIQQLENNLIVPKVMQKVTGLNPIVTIVVVLVGGTLGGVVGVILAIPLTLIADAFLEDFFSEPGTPSAPAGAAGNDV